MKDDCVRARSFRPSASSRATSRPAASRSAKALRTLELRGLVEVRQGSTGGYFVREADDRPLVRDFETLFRLSRISRAQLLEARRFIEPEVAFLAARRATDVDLKALGAALEQRSEQEATGLARRLDFEFHRLARPRPRAIRSTPC